MKDAPTLLDLYCGAGGAGSGYARAGFNVVGVDVKEQPNYQFAFIRAVAIEYLLRIYRGEAPYPDAIHASPPCQRYSNMTKRNGHQDSHPDLIADTRELLRLLEVPYVIENVPGAPLRDPITLCGSTFRRQLRRHRLFESNVPLIDNGPCLHHLLPRNIRIMNRGWKKTRFVPVYGSGGCKARKRWQDVMGIDWTNVTKELTEAIPPYYTEYIGRQLLKHVRAAA